MSKQIVFDIDDTVADLSDVFIRNLNKYTIKPVKPAMSYDDTYTRSIIDPSLGIITQEDWLGFLHDKVLSKEDFKNFKPIPGAFELIHEAAEQGWTIDFCSRVNFYGHYPEIKYEWLKKQLDPGIDWDLIIVSKDRSKRFLSRADYVIDDSVKVCIELDNVIVPVKPWNEDYVHNNGIPHFESYSQLGLQLKIY